MSTGKRALIEWIIITCSPFNLTFVPMTLFLSTGKIGDASNMYNMTARLLLERDRKQSA